MAEKKPFRTKPWDSAEMPPGIPFIIGNEAAERFSFYGMKAILTIFMVKYLWLMGDSEGVPMSDSESKARFHLFSALVYATPFMGAFLADFIFGKYRIIIWLSLVYCLGHGALAFMGVIGSAEAWFSLGLWLIIFGSGGIKPCVSAHVGDQFGQRNQHLLTKIFNWFYFSINLGACVSSLMTPWLLEWYGPHWAFGVPGILMLIATICFWAGRYRFVHIPAKGDSFLKDAMSKEGLAALGKLAIIYVFVAVFWALFDQTGSSWVLQAENMNRQFLGITWLPSQFQALNPILILTFIPLFAYVVYPFVNRFFLLTPLRKISIGLFLMVIAFAIVAIAQERIDAGGQPSISWQILGYILLTASEVMVSIVGLEFSYTQAPRSMKSLVMALFFFAVFAGNFFTGIVNYTIELDSPVVAEWKSETQIEKKSEGFDRKINTVDDIVLHRENGLQFNGKEELTEVAAVVETEIEKNGFVALDKETGNNLISVFTDPYGNKYVYSVINRNQCRITSPGPDNKYMTKWDVGVFLNLSIPEEPSSPGGFTNVVNKLRPDIPWLERRKEELGISASDTKIENGKPTINRDFFAGGQTRLEGAAYFWFFTWLMLASAVLFMVVAYFYKQRTYLYEEGNE